jgi:hypothetical protein
LQVESIATCRFCDTDFEVVFQAPEGVYEVEDLEDPISQIEKCPACGKTQAVTYDGWIVHGDAG